MKDDAATLVASIQELPPAEKRFSAYPAYTKTGHQWLAEIPSHWRLRRLKFISSLKFSNVNKTTEEGEELIHLCNYVDVYNRDYITADVDFMAASATREEVRRFSLAVGDVLVTKDSEEWNDIAVPALVDEELPGVLCGYHLAQIRPDSRKIKGEYLFRAFSAHPICDQFRVAANGITRFGLSVDGIASGWFLLPPLEEQDAIGRFLRHETAKIDSLIAKKRQLIDLMREKRIALISRAVTRGLDPGAQMKSSAIDGLGHVPEHWDIRRLKFMTPRITVGIVVTPSKYYIPAGVPCLRSLNVRDGRLTDCDLVFISDDSNELHAKSIIREGDVVAVRSGQPGATAVVDTRFDGANCIDLIIIRRSPKFDSQFLAYAMGSPYVQGQFFAGADGAIQQHFNITTATNLLIAFPPPTEQVAIRRALDESTSRIRILEMRVQQAIEKLTEYRSALVSAAVTGKIDVRGEVAT